MAFLARVVSLAVGVAEKKDVEDRTEECEREREREEMGSSDGLAGPSTGGGRINTAADGFPGSRGGTERCCMLCASICGVILIVLGGCAWLLLAPVLYNGIIAQNFVTSPVSAPPWRLSRSLCACVKRIERSDAEDLLNAKDLRGCAPRSTCRPRPGPTRHSRRLDSQPSRRRGPEATMMSRSSSCSGSTT